MADDVARARDARARRPGLLTAPTRVQPGGFRWNASLARYIDSRGRIVAAESVRSEIDRSVLSYDDLARGLADQLRAGEISLAAWEGEMRVVIKDVQLLSAAAAHGGWAQLDRSAFGRVGRLVRDQYAFLDRFAREVSSGKQKLDGSLTNRAVMYAEAGRQGYEDQREALERAAGYDEERNVLSPADHCDGPRGCPAQTARGWVPTGELVPIGKRPCRTRCRCKIERRRSAESERRIRARRRGPRTSRQRRNAA
jgi:hypothetical protein